MGSAFPVTLPSVGLSPACLVRRCPWLSDSPPQIKGLPEDGFKAPQREAYFSPTGLMSLGTEGKMSSLVPGSLSDLGPEGEIFFMCYN